MDTKGKSLLIKIVSIALIALIPMASADAVTKPKAAGRTAASIPNTILSGFGAPSNAIGIDGDFYIDTKNLNIYGPKMKKKWPKAVSLKGSNGLDGTDGKSGSDGKTVTNASTVAGPIGVQGFQGAPGDIGPKGEQGLRGEVGATGEQGVAGPAGAQGSIGLTGAIGIQGPAGFGSQGAPGATGATGAQGPGGATGSQGPSGSGATGPQGPAGPTGTSGANGNVGATGSTGPQGATGPTGLTGAQGTSGAAGSTGLTGNVGATGAKGDQGIQGENGFSQVTWVPILTWSLSTSVPGAVTDSPSFASLAIGKTYYVNISVHGISSKLTGYFTAELIPSSTPTFFMMDQSVSEANVYNGISSSHTYSFVLHGVITVGASVTSFTLRVSDGAGITTSYPMTLIGKAAFVMVGSIA
uniref:hypothetical protein n=1 Tax=Candidatus Planktophila sp. TaxID=2175601 RepID=UPI00404B96EB